MAIYVCGDTHGPTDIDKIREENWPEQVSLTENDFLIILGDFGLIWGNKETLAEVDWLDYLEERSFTTLFVDGNHENFDRLYKFPRVKFHNGYAHQIRSNVYHLMRGYVFDLQGHSFFAFGGAKTRDIQDGIIRPKDFRSLDDAKFVYAWGKIQGLRQRIEGVHWWKQELPSIAERNRGIKNLEKVNFEVDYVITHCLPCRISTKMYPDDEDIATLYLDILLDKGLKFKAWHCGHYHRTAQLEDKYYIHFNDIQRIV